MSEVKRIRLQICPDQSHLLLALTDRILNLKRIGLSVLLSASLTAMILIGGVSNDAAAPLAIFSGLVTALFAVLLGYALSMRPKLRERIRAEAGRGGQAVFSERSFVVTPEGGPERQLDYRAIRGQYWAGNHYVLYLDSGAYQSLLCFAIDENSFDGIYMLADALTRRRRRLVQVRMNSREEKGEGK